MAELPRTTPGCKHQRTRSTLLWPPEANTVTCEDCGVVVSAPVGREATAHVERPTRLRDGKTYCACGSPWPCDAGQRTAWQPHCPSCGLHVSELEPGHFAPLDPATGTWSCPNGGSVQRDSDTAAFLSSLARGTT